MDPPESNAFHRAVVKFLNNGPLELGELCMKIRAENISFRRKFRAAVETVAGVVVKGSADPTKVYVRLAAQHGPAPSLQVAGSIRDSTAPPAGAEKHLGSVVREALRTSGGAMELAVLALDPEVKSAKRRLYSGDKLKSVIAGIAGIEIIAGNAKTSHDIVRLVGSGGGLSGHGATSSATRPAGASIAAAGASTYVHTRSAQAPVALPVESTYASLVATRAHDDSHAPLDSAANDVGKRGSANMLQGIASSLTRAPIPAPTSDPLLLKVTTDHRHSAHQNDMWSIDISGHCSLQGTLTSLLLSDGARGPTLLDAGCTIATRSGGADAFSEGSLLGCVLDDAAPVTSLPIYLNVAEPFCFVTVGVQV